MISSHRFLALAVLMGLPLNAVSAAEQAGVTAAVQGDVDFLSVLDQKLHRATGGEEIYLGDEISSAPKSGMQLMLLDETVFTIGPDTDLSIDDFVYDPATGAGQMTASLTKGLFRFVAGNIAKGDPDDMQINLPTGTIGIRGTTGIIQILPGPGGPGGPGGTGGPDGGGLFGGEFGEGGFLADGFGGDFFGEGGFGGEFFSFDGEGGGDFFGDFGLAGDFGDFSDFTEDCVEIGGSIVCDGVVVSDGTASTISDFSNVFTLLGTATYGGTRDFFQLSDSGGILGTPILGTVTFNINIDFTNKKLCFSACTIAVSAGGISDFTNIALVYYSGRSGGAFGIFTDANLNNTFFNGTFGDLVDFDDGATVTIANNLSIQVFFDDGTNSGATPGVVATDSR